MEPSNTQLLGCGWTQPAQCPPTFFMTCPPAGNAGGQAQAQFPTLSCTIPVVCAITQIAGCGSQAQAQTMYHTQIGCPVSVPPHCPTVAPMCPPPQQQNTAATVCTQIGCPPPAGAGGGQAQAQFPTLSCTIPVVCAITQIAGCGNQAQAQFPTLSCTIPVVCAITQIAGCGSQAQAQAQTMFHTQIGCPVSVPPHCPTVAPMCPPPQQQNTAATVCTQIGCPAPGGNAGGQAQAQIPTLSCTFIPVLCAITQIAGCGSQAQAQTMYHTQVGCPVSVPPHCPTVAPMCPPPQQQNVSVATQCPTVAPMCPVTQWQCPPNAGGGQAQAQAATMPVAQCVTTVIPTVHCTGIWPIC